MLESLRSKVFAFLSALMLLSLLGVGVSFWITQQVNSRLSEVNLRSVPMQRELTQLASDTDLLKRELDRSLGYSHWSDPRWKPRRIPVWAIEVHRSTLERIKPNYLNSKAWQDWYQRLMRMNGGLSALAEQLFLQLQNQNFDKASELYPAWIKSIDMIQKEVEWAKREMDRETRLAFQNSQSDVQTLRIALQLLLLVVIGVSLMMLWMGERALRPIGSLRKIVKQITERGALTAEERSSLPLIPISKTDEVSELAREFHQMATSLIERERTIEFQRNRLEEQNKMLMQMGELQKRLQQAEHLAAVGRMSAQVAHEVGNPLHSIGLEAELALDTLTTQDSLASNPQNRQTLKQSIQSILHSVERLQKIIQNYLRLSKLTPDHQASVDFGEIIETALATYANSLQAMSIQVSWNLSQDHSGKERVTGDPDLLEYALGNLIRNSIQALESTPVEKRKICMETRLEGKFLCLDFSDNGSGMSESVKQDLFKPFMTTKAQGTGLGLSFVKKVFTDLGGDFVLKFSEPNEGVHFEGRLPIEKPLLRSPEANA